MVHQITVCSSVLEKAAYQISCGTSRKAVVDELKTVTVSHHYELSLVTWHMEHVKQMRHFKRNFL